MFESLKEINIGKLSIENPKKNEKAYIDLEARLTDEQWKAIKKYVAGCRGVTPLLFAEIMACIKLLFPERFLELDLNEEDYKKSSDSIGQTFGFKTKTLQAAHVRILFPERMAEFKKLIPFSEIVRKIPGSEMGPWTLVNLKILYPVEVEEHLKRKEVKTELAFARKVIKREFENKEWNYFVQDLAFLRIISPEDNLLNLMSGRTWKEIEAEFEKQGWLDVKENTLRGGFLLPALSLKLLAAKEIKITESGMEIIMPEKELDLKESVPPLPIVKKYK